MDQSQEIKFNYTRRFGAEFEVNDFEGRDYKNFPLEPGEVPLGSDYIALLIKENLNKDVAINDWHHTHHNNIWIIKPDSSCGIEICPPPTRGWSGLKEIVKFSELMQNDDNIIVDDRCSFHLHVDVGDLSSTDIKKIMTYWIKCETVFLDSVPHNRKKNRYCQHVGLSDIIQHDHNPKDMDLIRMLGDVKYYTMNSFHLKRGNRSTLEFRIIEAEGCLDPFIIKNWVRLIVHFVECALDQRMPRRYKADDPWSSFCWLDPKEVMELLKFDGSYELSKGMQQTRDWFIARLAKNIQNFEELEGIWSAEGRKIAIEQLEKIIEETGVDIEKSLKPENFNESLYEQTNSI